MRALLPLLLFLLGCGDASAPLTIFAAASTTDAVEELALRFRAETGVPVACSFAASSTLARQLAAGAPGALFLSADTAWMAVVEREGWVGARVELLGNRLVLVAPRGKEPALSLRPDFPIATAFAGRLALGDPEHVPAGRYARAALTALGWWEALADRLQPAADVRAALRLVEAGECALGVVYASDAAASQRVTVVGTLDSPGLAIRYPLALAKDAPSEARALYDFLQSPAAAEVFRAHGFTPLGPR